MKDYKPYAYLYKHELEPSTLKSRIITQVPAEKTIVLRNGDPSTVGTKTQIRYSIEDAAGTKERFMQFENEFPWDGARHEVEVIIGSGSGDDGGKNVTSSDYGELD